VPGARSDAGCAGSRHATVARIPPGSASRLLWRPCTGR
jgi:hypothetical protein